MTQQTQSLLPDYQMWAFIVNRIVIECDLPFELAPGCFIAKANQEQRDRIKEELVRIREFSLWYPTHFYEYETVVVEKESGTQFVQESLPEVEWRYYVVTTPDNGLNNIKLHYAASISDTPLDLSALNFLVGSGGKGYRPLGLIRHFYDTYPAQRISHLSLVEIREIYRSLNELNFEIGVEGDFPEISRAFEMIDALSLLPESSNFHVLGLFAIIEMLITHNPKLEDRGDSITHQMQSKIPLLARRFDRPLAYGNFANGASEKKIWGALYKYRSSLAHGGKPDFQSGELNILKSAENAKEFLNTVVKALVRDFLKEPFLYQDLRKC